MASNSDQFEMSKISPDNKNTSQNDLLIVKTRQQSVNDCSPNSNGQSNDKTNKSRPLTKSQNKVKNWIKQNVKIKECDQYFKLPADTTDDPKCMCGQVKSAHSKKQLNNPNTEWKVADRPANAFGELEFDDCDNQVAKFVRVGTCDETDIKEMLTSLLIKLWHLQKPNLLISVTGGAKNFDMKSRLKEVFRRGLQKAAESTGAWIVTGGTNAGVMKHVGEAMKEISITDEKRRIVAIGVAPWGCTQNREKLIDSEGQWPSVYSLSEQQKENETYLDPNHTHFLLVDNGTQNKWGTEIEFRSNLEKAIAEMDSRNDTEARNIPVVLLVLQGGPGTFKTVHGAIKNKTPTVVIKGSGGAADILATAFQKAYPRELTSFDKTGKETKQTVMELDQATEEELISMDNSITGYMDKIKESIQDKDLLTVFELDSRNSTQHVDMAILKALLKANRNDIKDQLELALVWDKMDIAKNEILGDDHVDKKILADKMLTAIQRDRVSFVDLFIDHGVNLKRFLTKAKLLTLYQTIPDNCLLRTQLNRIKCKKPFTMDHIGELMQYMIGDYYIPYYFKESYTDQHKTNSSQQIIAGDYNHKVEHPIQDLFIWSLFMNRQEMAKLFWKELDEPMAAALFANSLYRAMKTKAVDSEISQILQDNADEFSNLAIGVLNSCYKKDETKAQDLLIRELKNWGLTTCVLMAVQADNKRFISQTACQTLLNSIWMGNLSQDNSIFRVIPSIILFPLIFMIVKFKAEQQDEEREMTSDELVNQNLKPMESANVQDSSQTTDSPKASDRETGFSVKKILLKIKSFYLAPAVIFYLNVVTYIIFLSIYSYHVLFSFNKTFTILEGILCGWVVTIFVEEMRQVITSNATSVGSKFKTYFNDSWNILDLITIFLFAAGIILRFLPNDITFEIARVLLCLNLISFYFRILHIFSVNKQLGPKLVMIRRMVQDLMSFVVILAVFITAYAVATEAILYPNSEFSWKSLYYIPRKAYWQIYGELFLEDLEGESDCISDPALYGDYNQLRCPSEIGKFLAPVFMGVYVLMTNVLLLNLLIAMFSYTFQKIQDNTDLHWFFQRYHLVHEYYSRPFLPSPAIIVVHVYLVIKYFCGKCCGDSLETSDINGFRKKYDNIQEERQLIQWENVISETYCNRSEQASIESLHQRYNDVLQKLEHMSTNDYQDGSLQESMPSQLENRLQSIEQKAETTHEVLEWIMTSLSEHKLASKSIKPKLTDIQERLEKDARRKQKKLLRNEQLRHFFKEGFQVHVKCRNTNYCDTSILRAEVKDEEVCWAIKVPKYNPQKYTAEKILQGKAYADPFDLLKLTEEERQNFKFNVIDENKVDRTSLCGFPYEIKHGLPLNPRGRTGIVGRGQLGRWGPNHAADTLVTRWKRDEEHKIEHKDGKPCLELIAIQRKDTRQWAIPGILKVEGFSNPGKKLSEILIEIFAAEALGNLMMDPKEKPLIEEKLQKLAAKGKVIYEGYADDQRNTDNAWTETRVILYHDDDGDLLKDFTIRAGEAVNRVSWILATSTTPYWGNHQAFICLGTEELKAHF